MFLSKRNYSPPGVKSSLGASKSSLGASKSPFGLLQAAEQTGARLLLTSANPPSNTTAKSSSWKEPKTHDFMKSFENIY